MREILSPFKTREKFKQVIICILIFLGMAVPFKVMVLIPGLTEVRPVNAVPVVVGLLLGPAGAWGCAFGNLIADVFGTFSNASILGFFGNFTAAYVPYKLWHLISGGTEPNVKSGINLIKYIIISFISALSTAIILACGLDIFFRKWIPGLFWIILFNDFCFPLFLGLPVFIIIISDDINFKITMPEEISIDKDIDKDNKRYLYLKYFLPTLMLTSELIILIMIVIGKQMSSYIPMYITGAVFIIALLSFIVFRYENKLLVKKSSN
ncbi:hypothetical protein CLHOM_15110 [Clostridium homopropionicum DSM 5847]|uniref:QueT transporter n=1 Tax=Clostridium homopropionicum DSM 5847 TaxID=1121318 RepID=A0A0L6ZAT0_9CLOT|nr:QueT transporter family protein [Clostridium homopropionicum]KOA20081.1 hypothetical protein CLHOM_15110 [Clostridium homopropionicum DSM 5847]SFG86143.1 energy-coupling factor transport system substrate-specific component [Clostridium homopropionicum]